MDDSNETNQQPEPPQREIANANLFADDIIFSDTEKILFEEDLQQRNNPDHEGLMAGNPEERYTPTKKLNQGGMKAIWEVDDHRTARKVAMALIQDSKIASKDDIDSFLYEARLTSNLQHPNIIPIYDIALDENGNPYFTMKALRGETLGDIIKQIRSNNPDYTKRYTRTRLLGIFLKVCNAIDYAHTKGVIHLDLKPSNINVGDFGDVYVLDWGLSTLITHLSEYEGEAISWQSMDDVSLENGQTLTRYLEGSAKRREHKNVVGGTPGYMSPEQAQGSPSDIDFQTDVYMLGALLYEILTGHCPIHGETVRDVLQKTVRGEIIEPTKQAPEQRIPPALAAIAMKALSLDASDRYPNVAALISDIHKYQDGYATLAENPTFFTHAALLIKRHKLAISIISAAAAIIAAILTNSFIEIKQSERVAVAAKNLATQRLEELEQKNAYIEATAKKVAPDYLKLMQRAEHDYEFAAAEQALDTGLAFDPSLANGWLHKAKILLCQQRYTEAHNLLSGAAGHPVLLHVGSVKLAETLKETTPASGMEIPGLVDRFTQNDLTDRLPRLFHHLNQTSFKPQAHFAALSQLTAKLNPEVDELNFNWKSSKNGWSLDLSNNNLTDLTPLCGLDIERLDLSGSGTPDLKPLTRPGLRELRLAGCAYNHLPVLESPADLETLDLSQTQIRNLVNITQYPKLTSLDISGIEGLTIPPQLIWCRNLEFLTLARSFRLDPTVQTLAKHGVILIFTDR